MGLLRLDSMKVAAFLRPFRILALRILRSGTQPSCCGNAEPSLCVAVPVVSPAGHSAERRH